MAAEQQSYQILRPKGSYEAFGILIDFLSRQEPFSRYDLGNFAQAVMLQLQNGDHLAAVARHELVGYCGWLPTNKKVASAWLKNQGTLAPLKDATSADALALTVVAARDRRILFSLIRQARASHPQARIYFKREYQFDRKPARKNSVRNSHR